MSQSKRVILIGGGVVGAACAHYLLASSWQVTLIEKGTFGGGCSHGNCGLVCPSHVLPLAGPGVLLKTLKAMCRRDSPFYIKPRFDFSLWRWLLSFAGKCNRRDMLRIGHSRWDLLQSSLSLYQQLMADETLSCEWEQRGTLYVYRTPEEFKAYEETDKLLRSEFDLPAVPYAGDAVCELEPALKPGLAGGWHYPTDAHLRPDRLMTSWKKSLLAAGLELREGCTMREFRIRSGEAQAVLTSEGEELKADAFVLCAGAFTPSIGTRLGCRIPVQPGKGYSLTMPRPAKCPAIPLLFPEHKVVVTPWASGYRIGSTMEFSGFDASHSPRRLALLSAGATPYLHEPTAAPTLETWSGFRPMTTDDNPIIGPCPSVPNVYLSTGHGMLGITLAPATGKLLAELLNNSPPHVDPTPFSVGRF